MLRAIKEDTIFMENTIVLQPAGNGRIETGFYRRFVFENDDITWMYLIEKGDYDANSFSIRSGKAHKKLEELYQESEKRLIALNRDKQIDSIVSD